jgi:hypothetical protein
MGSRLAVGTILALGLYLGCRKLVTGAVLATQHDANEWWMSFEGLLAVYTTQAVAVVFGSIIAAAGRLQGYLHGLGVGVVCGGLFLVFEVLTGAPTRDLVVYLQPPVLALLGLVAGVVGARIWSAAPVLDIPVPNPSKLSSITLLAETPKVSGRPTLWVRVLAGAMVILMGVTFADRFRHYAQTHSGGLLRVQSLGQGEFITWQLAVFAVLLGGVAAGAGTGAGIRHGVLSGAIGGLAVLVICLKQGSALPPIEYSLVRLSLEKFPITAPGVCAVIAGSVFLVGMVGGWLGGALFLPLAPESMRKRLRIGRD